jgi:hypothetical protein
MAISSSIFSADDYRPNGPHRGDVVITIPAKPATAEQTAFDAQLVAILESPLLPNETAMLGYQRKELELISQLHRLTVLESRALHARLSAGRDALAVKFMRLTIERRTRVLAFLADARRRAAIGIQR